MPFDINGFAPASPNLAQAPLLKLAMTLPGSVQQNVQPPQPQLNTLQFSPAAAAPQQPAPQPMPFQMPQPAPQMPAPPPQTPPPVNPYGFYEAGTGAPGTLSTPDRQAQLGQAWDKMLQSVVSGPDKKAQRAQAASQIFNGAAAILGGAMGRGYAQGGLQVLQQAQQDVRGAQNEKRLQQQEAMTGLKSLNDIISNTDPNSQKNLAAALNGHIKERTAAVQGFKAQTQANHYEDISQRGQQRNGIMQTHYNNMDTLKKYGIDMTAGTAAARLAHVDQIAADRNEVQMKIAELRANASKYRTDKNYDGTLKKLERQDRALAQTQRFSAEKFDSEMEAKLGRRDSMGNLVYQGVTVPKLADQLDMTEEGSGNGTDQGQQPQTPAAPSTAPTAQSAPKVAPPAGAFQMYTTNRTPVMRQFFMQKYGVDPEAMLGGK